MELSTLKFVVDTKELETAATRIEELGTAVNKLNKPMQNLTRESAKTNKELSKAEEHAAKAALAQHKLEQAQTKSNEATGKSISLLERHNLILQFQAEGNSKGQASILATAKAAGMLDHELLELNKTLVLQRTLMGTEPFDNSIGLHQKLQNQTKITEEVTELFNRSLGLTEKQMVDLAREKQRLIALYGIEGKSLDGLAAEYEQIVQMSKQINQANDARTNSMKAQIKAENDSARANEYLAKEMERVNRLNSEGADITSATNNRLIRFERELKASGASAAEAATKLDAYRNALLSAQKVAGNRQIDYLSRALGPQITDIAVGLATGQAPLTILLQQGGQLRDQFALAGVAGADMGKMLIQASKAMVSSVKDVGLAVGQVFVGAIVGSGKAVTNFAMDITGANVLLNTFRSTVIATAGASSTAIATFDKLGKVITVGMGVGVFAAIALLIGLVVEYSKVIAAEKELTKSLAMSGAALAMSTEDAIKYAESMNAVGIGTMDAMRMIAEFANTGADASIPLEEIIKSAKDMQKYVGIASADTMKAFGDIAEKPVEGLIKLAKTTGNVTAETILQAEAAVKAGNNAEAARIAQEALSNSNAEVVKRMKNNLDPLQTLWMDIKSGISQAGQALYEFLKSSSTVAVFRTVWETVAVIVTEVWYVLKQTGNEISGIFSQIKAVMSGDFAGAARIGDQMKIDAAAAKVEQDKLVASIMNRNKAEKETLSVTEAQRTANRNAAKEIEDRIKKEGKGKQSKETKELTELEKERIQFLKVMSDLEDRASGFTKNYSDQLNILNIGLTEGWLTQDQFNIKLHELNKVQPSVIKAHKDHADALEKFTQAQKKADDALFDSLDVQHQLNMQVLEQTDLLALEGSLIGATDIQRKKALATKRLDLQLEKEIADIRKRNISQSEKDDQENQARQRRLDNEKNLNTEIANDSATKTLEEYNKIKDGIADSIVTALIEGGKAGSKKLRDLIVAELRKKITIEISALVDVGMNALVGGGSKGGSFAESIVGSFLQKQVGGIAVGGTTLGAGAAALGQGFISNLGAGAPVTSMGSATSASFNAGASFAPYVPYVAAALVALNALGAFRSTKQVGGGISGTLGAATPTSEITTGGLRKRTITVPNSIQQYATMRKSGTLFSGPDYWRENQGTFAGNEVLQQTFKNLRDSTVMMAEVLGVSSDSVRSFTKTIDISFDGLTNEQIQEKIGATFKGINDELAALVLGAGATAEQLSSLYNTVMQQRYDLETQLLELQGDTLALRERERAKIYETNKGLFDQIKALEDKKAADEKAAEAMQKLTDVTTSIVDEINRLRGVNTSQSGLESQFAILTAQARSGDLSALAQLPEVTKGLEQIAASTAVNATDIIFARARLAQSLQDTLGYTGGFTASATTSMASIGSVSASGTTVTSNVSSASSNQELLAAMVIELQGLRAEVRADVSHNAKTAKILERANQDGETLSVSATIDGGVV